MAIRVVLDANVVLAGCLDPAMDAKAGLAAQVFATLKEEAVRPAVTESIQSEIEVKIGERVGQILDAVRELANDTPSFPLDPGETTLEVLERLFAKLRRGTTSTGAALQLLESRLASIIKDTSIANESQWTALFGQVAIETTTLFAEVQRRRDALSLEVLARSGKANHERFRDILRTGDLEHISVLAAISEARNLDIVFVTLDSALHGRREEIAKVAPRITVTTPTFLRRQIDRLRGKE